MKQRKDIKSLNPTKYLMPKNVDRKDSAIGIVLAFQLFTPVRVTILLFYDYRTGRIERYLVNSSLDSWNWWNIFTSNTSNFSFNKDKYLVENKDIHSLVDFQGIYNPVSKDGKFSLKFYEDFIQELMRDYLWELVKQGKPQSFNYTNMDVIRSLTRPSLMLKRFNMGSGVMSDTEKEKINDDDYLKLRNIRPYSPDCFIKTDYKLNLLIHVPKKFEKRFESADIDEKTFFKALPVQDYSQGVIDLKRSLQIKTVTSLSDLESRIRTFNYNIVEQLRKTQEKREKYIDI